MCVCHEALVTIICRQVALFIPQMANPKIQS
jgi:hypothetical protein